MKNKTENQNQNENQKEIEDLYLGVNASLSYEDMKFLYDAINSRPLTPLKKNCRQDIKKAKGLSVARLLSVVSEETDKIAVITLVDENEFSPPVEYKPFLEDQELVLIEITKLLKWGNDMSVGKSVPFEEIKKLDILSSTEPKKIASELGKMVKEGFIEKHGTRGNIVYTVTEYAHGLLCEYSSKYRKYLWNSQNSRNS